jgi:hypothetical protein
MTLLVMAGPIPAMTKQFLQPPSLSRVSIAPADGIGKQSLVYPRYSRRRAASGELTSEVLARRQPDGERSASGELHLRILLLPMFSSKRLGCCSSVSMIETKVVPAWLWPSRLPTTMRYVSARNSA